MTRFARAKGSKSSNEKTPDDGTPWEVMKDQLLQSKKETEEAKKRQEAEKQRIENYENFLKEQKVKKRKATWCDFPEEVIAKKENAVQNGDHSAKKMDKKSKVDNNVVPNIEAVNLNEEHLNKKKKNKSETGKKSSTTECNITDTNDSPPKPKRMKNEKKEPEVEQPVDQSVGNGQLPQEATASLSKSQKRRLRKRLQKDATQPKTEVSETASAQDFTKLSKSQKRKLKKKNKSEEDSIPTNNKTEDSKNSGENKDFGKKHKGKPDKSTTHKNNNTLSSAENENNAPGKSNNHTKKKKKLVDGQPARRKEINDKSFQLIINSKEVELIRFDGFPVMKKDAERLEELKTNMIKKGIPKSEVQRTLKLERRRAEKALARLKRDVCYNCRKGGHNLSDCPELKSKIPGVDAADGVCFRCGSTEHKAFQCKVQKDKEFRFATCFICKEPGHIARQCPDNPKGLYPNGGSCKLCGDVTHLRKDCPTVMGTKEETSVKLQTLDSAENIEDIGQQTRAEVAEPSSKKPKKIKF